LLAARRASSAGRSWPALRDRQHTTARLLDLPADGPVAGDPNGRAAAILVLERGEGGVLRAVANLTPETVPVPAPELAAGRLVLSTEDFRYGGNRASDQSLERLLPYEMLVFSPVGYASA
jgi:hypothetical protein